MEENKEKMAKELKEEKKEQTQEDLKTEESKTTLQQKQEEIDEITDRYKRILAEFENYKKRSIKEREGMYQSILGDVVSAILPVLDNLEKAATATSQDEAYKQGVEMVLKQYQDVLKNLGVEEIEATGVTFDPEVHEAVSSIEDENLGEKEIKEVFRKGYKIGNKVIRHAMVVVAN